MAEYTPTTAEVRGIYAVYGYEGNNFEHPDNHQSMDKWRAEFDRWLEGTLKTDNISNIRRLMDQSLADSLESIVGDLKNQDNSGDDIMNAIETLIGKLRREL